MRRGRTRWVSAALLQNHPRHLAVLQAPPRWPAGASRWRRRPTARRVARGVALHQSFGSIVAQVAEVSLDPADKRIRVHRVVAVPSTAAPPSTPTTSASRWTARWCSA
jgi:isoquinoline 1-oxidoreductase beta subunit